MASTSPGGRSQQQSSALKRDAIQRRDRSRKGTAGNATDEFVQAVDRASEEQGNGGTDRDERPSRPLLTSPAHDKWLTPAPKRVITMAARGL